MQNQTDDQPNDLGELLSIIISTWNEGNIKSCKEYLKHLCNNTTPDFLRKVFGDDSNRMMEWYCIFNDTGLPEEPEGTPSRKAFINLHNYICDCDNPRIKKALDDTLKHCYPNLKPCGYDEKGALYNITDLAKALNVTLEKLLAEAEIISEIKKGLQTFDYPKEDNNSLRIES